MRLLVAQHVDLIMQAHNHMYERSKQLAQNATTCTSLAINSYNSACVVDTGADGLYTKSRGSVVVTLGSSGMTLGKVNTSDPEYPYFVATNANSFGATKFTVTPTSMTEEYIPAVGTFSDSFTISAP
jgi:hypothetical protein